MTEADFLRALRALARVSGKDDDFVIDRHGVALRVQHYPGSSSHVELSTPYVGRAAGTSESYRGGALMALAAPRPMQIALRREKPSDAAAKRSGVAVEAQTGDPEFDDAVYIDSPSSREVIQHVLGAAPARDAVRALLALGIGPITLDGMDLRIRAHIGSFGSLRSPETVLDHLATLANHLPEVRASGKRPPIDVWQARAILLGLAAFLGVFASLFSTFMLLPDVCYVSDGEGISLTCEYGSCCTPSTIGLLAGGLVGLVLAIMVWGRIRGTSSAHTVRPWAAFFTLVVTIEVCVTAASVVGAVALRLP